MARAAGTLSRRLDGTTLEAMGIGRREMIGAIRRHILSMSDGMVKRQAQSSPMSTTGTRAGNPYYGYAEQVEAGDPFHAMPTWLTTQCYTILALLIIAIVLHSSALLVPVARGRGERSKHMWFAHVKRVSSFYGCYGGSSGEEDLGDEAGGGTGAGMGGQRGEGEGRTAREEGGEGPETGGQAGGVGEDAEAGTVVGASGGRAGAGRVENGGAVKLEIAIGTEGEIGGVRGRGRRRGTGAGGSYIIPNGRLFSGILSLLSSLVFGTQLVVILWWWEQENDVLFCVVYVFLFVQEWLCSFDALFADALCALWTSPSPASSPTSTSFDLPSRLPSRLARHFPSRLTRFRLSRWLRHPLFLNLSCWGVPLVMVATQSTLLGFAWARFLTARRMKLGLYAALLEAAAAFDKGALVDSASLLGLVQTVEDTYGDYLHWFRILSYSMTAWLILACCVFILALALLARTVLQSKRQLATVLHLHTSASTTSVIAVRSPIVTNPVFPATSLSPITVAKSSISPALFLHEHQREATRSNWQPPEEWGSSLPLTSPDSRSATTRPSLNQRAKKWFGRMRRSPTTAKVGRDRRRWHLALFLVLHAFLLVWVIVGLFLLNIMTGSASVAQQTNLDYYRRCYVIMAWPVALTFILMGAVGLYRVCEGGESKSSSQPPTTPSTSVGRTVWRGPRSAPVRRSSTHVGLFADVDGLDEEKPKRREGWEGAKGGEREVRVRLGGAELKEFEGEPDAGGTVAERRGADIESEV